MHAALSTWKFRGVYVVGEPRWREKCLTRLKKQGTAGEPRHGSNSSARPRVLSLTVSRLDNCSADCKACSSTPAPHPLDASTTSVQQVSSYQMCQVFPGRQNHTSLAPHVAWKRKQWQILTCGASPGTATSPGDLRRKEENCRKERRKGKTEKKGNENPGWKKRDESS